MLQIQGHTSLSIAERIAMIHRNVMFFAQVSQICPIYLIDQKPISVNEFMFVYIVLSFLLIFS